MKEAVLYEKGEGKKVRCTACRHYCLIPDKGTGICGVRQNIDGKLYLIVYGKASAVNIDPVEKKPLFHFLPGTPIFSLGTVGCNFACDFCQNWDLSQATKDLRAKLVKEKRAEDMGIEVGKFGYELLPEKIVEITAEKKIPSIAYTYNEPIIFFEYLYDTAKLATKKGIKNVLVTNGYETDEALEKLKPYVQALNIDIKSFSSEFYTTVCKARLEKVLETIKAAKKLSFWVELTTLVIPGKNDSEGELQKIAKFIASVDKNMPWHVTAFFPQYKMTDVKATPASALEKAYNIGKKAGLNYVYVGNIADDEHSNTCCHNCNALLIKREGYFVEVQDCFKSGKCQNCGTKIPGVWK
ncbi:MAG: AmmeMemoRadiSam system radical SAM enzyme [Candidatus Woesearchaeota archaeon]